MKTGHMPHKIVASPTKAGSQIEKVTLIHLKLRHQQAQVQNNTPDGQQSGEGIPLNIARYKKTVSSIMWVQLALVACYVPRGIAAVLYVNGIKHDAAWIASNTLVYLNSSLNPILYCWKITEVKQEVKATIKGSFSLFRRLAV